MKRTCFIFLILMALSCSLQAQWLWDISEMKKIKGNINSLAYSNAYHTLLSQAERAMSRPPFSVTFKQGIAPSGNKHDYVSLSRYWWPNPANKNKLPYVYKDGQSNPELNQYDRNPLGDMCASVNTLALAFFYSGNEKYAEKAVNIIRVWFLDKKTKMSPHLEYAQFIPGRDNSKGRPEGLIDTYSFVGMLSSVQLLKGSKSYTRKDEKELQKWFADLAAWMQTSTQGKKEDTAKNNHATAYDSQLITYFLFSGQEAAAKKIINDFPVKRIFSQIEPDGKQPNELWRTLAFHYSEYNLSHMIDVFATAKKLGIELYNKESADGRSFYKAMDYLVTFLGKDVSSWPYKQISGWEDKQQDICYDLYRILDLDSSKVRYRKLYNQYSNQSLSDRNRLLYGAEDPVKKAFAFASSQFTYAFTRIDSVLKHAGSKNLVSPRSINKESKLVMVSPRDWCSGFFPGSLWFMYQFTKDDKWRNAADHYTRLLEGEKNDPTSHDVGFKIYCSFGNGYELTGDDYYKAVIIQAAETLSKRFNSKVGAIRSWDFNRSTWQFPVIIDNMMNLELLFEAARLSGNEIYHNIADAHTRTTLKNHFRNDYSSYHVVDYDTLSGDVRKKNTHQGYADDSAWARGQAWALYGFTLSYRYTKEPDYLKQAESIAGFIFNNPNLPRNLVPYWDYNDPAIPDAPRDASAAAITASALYELAGYTEKNRTEYLRLADAILGSLISRYSAKPKTAEGFLLLHSTGHYPHKSEVDVPISYADYYFLEALTRRKNINLQ